MFSRIACAMQPQKKETNYDCMTIGNNLLDCKGNTTPDPNPNRTFSNQLKRHVKYLLISKIKDRNTFFLQKVKLCMFLKLI